MKIEKINIKGFGKLKNFEAKFIEGINLIKGPNEAGKSTLVDALATVFFDDPKSSKKELKEKKSWGKENGFELKVEFASQGNSYILDKNFGTGESSLSQISTGEKWEDKRRIEKVISEELGISSKEVFLATALVKQDEMSRFAQSVDSIREKLESLITGGEEQIQASQVVEKLKEKLGDFKRVGTVNFGEIQKWEKKFEELSSEHKEAKTKVEDLEKCRKKLFSTKTNLKELSSELEIKQAELEKAKKAQAEEEKLKNLEYKFFDLQSRLKEIQNSERMVKRLREDSDKIIPVEKEDFTSIEEAELGLKVLGERKKEFQNEQEELNLQMQITKNRGNYKTLSLVFLPLALILGILAVLLSAWLFVPSSLILLSGIFFLFQYSTQKEHSRMLKIQLKQKQEKLTQLEEDIYQLNLRKKGLYKKYEVGSTDALKENFETKKEIERQIRNEVIRREDFLGGKTIKELEEQLRETTKLMAVADEKLKEIKPYVLPAEELERLESKVREKEQKKRELEISWESLTQELERLNENSERVASLEEKLEEAEKNSNFFKHKLLIYQKCAETIESARKEVIESTVPLLENKTSKFLSQVTCGKYTQIRFDRENLKFEVFSSEKGSFLEPDKFLSRGSIDQLYLSARLALLELISEERNPVVIMDDPFVTFDHKRRENALNLLETLSKNYQIILLTCHDFYDGCENQVLHLGEPAKVLEKISA
jgi:DNA repair exonuclease SbcCD ATPase subunit